MRILKNKRNRKLLHLYRTLHGVAPPYTVIVDGTFIHAAQCCTLDLWSLIPRLLQQDPSMVSLIVPTSAVDELRALGEVGEAALELALTFPSFRHGKGDTPAAVIANLIGDRNRKHYVVATQDVELRSALRKTAGVPLIYLNRTVLVLEPLSYASQNKARDLERKRSAPTKRERTAMAPRAGEGKKRKRAAAAAAAAAGGGGYGLIGDNASATASAPPPRAAKAAPPRARKKRKGPKGPNPLSVKKKKATAVAPKPAKKARRRRGGGRAGSTEGAGAGAAAAAGGG